MDIYNIIGITHLDKQKCDIVWNPCGIRLLSLDLCLNMD